MDTHRQRHVQDCMPFKVASDKNGAKSCIFNVFFTCNLTAIKFEPQSDAILPRLRPESYEASQNRLWDSIEDHFCGVSIGMENLWMENNRRFMLIDNYPEQEGDKAATQDMIGMETCCWVTELKHLLDKGKIRMCVFLINLSKVQFC